MGFRALLRALPQGRPLAPDQWAKRHRWVVNLLWAHAVGLALFGLYRGLGVVHASFEGGLIATAAAIASSPRLNTRIRSSVGALGLVSASAVFVHMSGGVIEVHFHFFVMVGLLSLYQDWTPFLVAIGFVVVHHGLFGWLDPSSVYNHPAAIRKPWAWALIHGAFVLAASVANVIAWRLHENTHDDLIQSEERFRRTFADAAVGMATVDVSGHYLNVNDAFCAITGYSADELRGMTFASITHPDDRDANVEEVLKLTSGETASIEIEKRYVRKDGRVVHCMNSGSAIRDADGTLKYMTAVVQDVTERRRAEEELRLISTVSLAVAEAPDLGAAVEVALRRVCEATGWVCGQVWLPSADGTALILAPTWYTAIPNVEPFRIASASFEIEPGQGLPGRVWASRQPAWIRDLDDDVNFPRATFAKAVGFTSAMAVPLLAGDTFVGVMEFFLSELREEDERMLALASVVAGQVGNLLQRKSAEVALRESEDQYRSTLATAHDAYISMDADGTILEWNRRAEQIFGWSEAEAIGRPVADTIVPEALREQHKRGLKRFLDTQVGQVLNQRLELTALRRHGGEFPVEITIWASRRRGQWCFNAFLQDITDRTRAQRDLQASEERYRSIVETAQEGVWVLDGRGLTTFVNSKLAEMLGRSAEDLLGLPAADFVDPIDVSAAASHLGAGRRTVADRVELRLRHRDESTLWVLVATSAVDDGTLAMVSDISERKAAEEALAHQAFHDTLTGLPNRSLFLDRLGHALSRSARRPASTAVLFLDLDRFKWVNDSLGHAVGDTLLQAAAKRLLEVVRDEDTVARFGGDEFAVLCEDMEDENEALAVGQRLVAAMSSPITVGDRHLTLTASVGIALASGPGANPDVLLRDADSAMYRAKERGRDRIELFDDDMRARAMARLETEVALRNALEHDELCVHFQPVVDLHGERVVGVEALVRWQHPERGLVPPLEFIPVAEDTGLIVPLGAYVVNEACQTIAAWNRARPDLPLNVSVNLSARQLASPGLRDVVATALTESGLAPELLCLEITESVLMEDADVSSEQLQSLKQLGVTLSVDDFGTGYSSLLYLRRFPVDVLKIDRSFVSGLGTSAEDSAIVAGVVQLAHALGLQSIAEGVEELIQVERLGELGCDLAQGFYWSRAMDAESLASWLQQSTAVAIAGR